MLPSRSLIYRIQQYSRKFWEVDCGKILLYCFTIAIYLPMIFTNVISIVLLCYCIYKFKIVDFYAIFSTKFVLVFFLFYVILISGFLYDIPYGGVFRGLEKKLSFLLLPITIGLIKINRKDIRLIFKLFFFTGIIITTFALLRLFLTLTAPFQFKNFINHELSGMVGLHATYLSMYLVFSLVYPLFFLSSIKERYLRVIIFVLTLLSILYILLLAVRIIWLILFILILFSGILAIINSRFILKHIYVGVLFLTLIISSFYMIRPLRERLKEVINYNNEYDVEKVWGGRGVRLMIWESCINLIQKKPILGYGSSTEVQNNLTQSYKDNNFGPLLYMMSHDGKKFNPHNQFLSEFLKHGVLFGLIYPFVLIYLILKCKEYRSCIGFIFIAIISGTSLSETILELNKGIIFFSYFASVIYFSFELNQAKISFNSN